MSSVKKIKKFIFGKTSSFYKRTAVTDKSHGELLELYGRGGGRENAFSKNTPQAG